jgi:hypothetical protein
MPSVGFRCSWEHAIRERDAALLSQKPGSASIVEYDVSEQRCLSVGRQANGRLVWRGFD